MENKDSLTIHIMDKEYRVACPDGEKDSLMQSAEILNQKLGEIKNNGAVIGAERIAIMAALNLSHEFINGKKLETKHTSLNERIKELSTRIDNTMREIQLV